MDAVGIDGHDPNLTRRDFLARGSAATVGAALGTSLWPAGARAGVGAGDEATVIRVRDENVVIGRRVHKPVLAEMLDKGLIAVTGKPDVTAAWRSLLKPDDVVALKFNQSGAEGLGTTVPMAEVLVRSLTEAGFPASQLVQLEVPPAAYGELGTSRPSLSWDREETSFGSGSDQLSAVLRQVTAIINVPFMKNHNIAGVTCCLKNLSHALVKHPARFHANHCSPFIADIVALPQIRDKLRLHIVNGLRTVFEGGPEATEEYTVPACLLLLGTDPVAVDTLAVEELNQQRQDHGLSRIEARDGKLGYLAAAGAHGLGCADLYSIGVKKIQD